MKTQHEFIKYSFGKKEKRQKFITFCLRKINKYIPLKVHIDKDKISNFIYLTICNKSSFDMVLASIYSLSVNSKSLPKEFIIVSDGSWEIEEGNYFFSVHGLEVCCVQWYECASFYRDSCPNLLKWANGHIWGKKMAAILYYSEHQRVLFSDPDILWYNTPITEDELCKIRFKVSVDNSHNYDEKFIESSGCEFLYDTDEPINCGAVFIFGGLSLLSEAALKCIEYESTHFGRFAEQTVFAIMDIEYNSRWRMNEITSEISDLLQPFTQKNIHYNSMIARHYLWRLKWIYWKDFFRMRFKM